MNKTITIGLLLTAALGLAISNVPSVDAQTTLGGSKPQQNKIGGVAKPAPVVGGATAHAYSSPPPKPVSVVGTIRPVSPGGVTPPTTTANALGQASGPRPNPPITTSKKSGAVVTSNMKCAGGVCTSRVPKP
jgi:hypothetical protein